MKNIQIENKEKEYKQYLNQPIDLFDATEPKKAEYSYNYILSQTNQINETNANVTNNTSSNIENMAQISSSTMLLNDNNDMYSVSGEKTLPELLRKCILFFYSILCAFWRLFL